MNITIHSLNPAEATRELEAQLVRHAMALADDHPARAAARMGISVAELERLCRVHGLTTSFGLGNAAAKYELLHELGPTRGPDPELSDCRPFDGSWPRRIRRRPRSTDASAAPAVGIFPGGTVTPLRAVACP